MKQSGQLQQVLHRKLVWRDLMLFDSRDAVTAGHVAGLAHGNTELIDISTLKVQHKGSPFQNGRPARFPADPIVHPAFAGALGMDESENFEFPESEMNS